MTKIIAHRGASRIERENTLAAFRAARGLGADMVELDVRLTADGALAVHHDARLPDGRAIATVEARALPGHVPLLPAAFDACRGMGVNVELKNSPGEPGSDSCGAVADRLLELLRSRLEAGDLIVSSFDLETIDRVRRAEPAIATAWLVTEMATDTLATLAGHGHSTLHLWHGSVTPDAMARCRRAGVAVNVWTCDEPERMRELARWGVAGICTNVPDLARQALESTAR